MGYYSEPDSHIRLVKLCNKKGLNDATGVDTSNSAVKKILSFWKLKLTG